ncbi:MAG: ATP-binding cassette domain-containing protein [Candidatus Dadabacteria bacterium]|nr:ATP-binding cassette domain-containing protein [Candidatus Dadabacteria bacterium]NIS09772.1 ATP-binding cassette domain-containing protein [Candidatus Dadabacteria bacterium]NIY22540.1 ATP-binding cassette domain-containing protein [Candidatus Dadabacteria bacterium]
MDEVVRISDLSFSYIDGVSIRYEGIDFLVKRGEKAAILGPIGSGKSTLLQHILGLLKSNEGLIEVFGHDPAKESSQIRRRIGTLLQNVDQQIIAPTVGDDICFSPRNYGMDEAETQKRVNYLMERLDITHLRDKVPHYLSGGEKTKVGIAGALAHKPELLILDEPFEGLDPVCRNDLVSLLNEIGKNENTSIIISTHNINVVPMIAEVVYIIAEGGTIIAKGTPEEIFTQVEMLRGCHIEPPVLSALFYELKNMGIELDHSFDIKEAASIISGNIYKLPKS